MIQKTRQYLCYLIRLGLVACGLAACSHAAPIVKVTVADKAVVKEAVSYKPCVNFVTSKPVVSDTPGKTADNPRHLVIDQHNKHLFKPMTRQEIKALIAMLQRETVKDGKGQQLVASDKNKLISAQRAGVLMQDILAELTRLHLGEKLKQMQGMANANPATIIWGQQVQQALGICGNNRFVDFGGELALAETRLIVFENRHILENLILVNEMPPGVTIPGSP